MAEKDKSNKLEKISKKPYPKGPRGTNLEGATARFKQIARTFGFGTYHKDTVYKEKGKVYSGKEDHQE